MIFIIPDAYNANKYAAKSRELFLSKSCIVRIDFCTEVDLFDAGVTNTILHSSNSTPSHQYSRIPFMPGIGTGYFPSGPA